MILKKYGPFLRKLSLSKVLNALGLVSSYIISKLFRTVHNGYMPVAMAIEPTTSCNLRCPECPSGLRSFTRPTGMLSEDLFQRLIDQVKDSLMYLTFYFQGEPYLHKGFLTMVNYAHKKGIYTSTSTNAHYLDPNSARDTVQSGLDRIIISIDGTSQETYESYRIGGSLSKVIEGTKNLIAAKKELKASTPFISFQFLVVRPNEHQIEEIQLLGRDLGVDEVLLKTAQIYDYESGSDLIPSLEKFSRYKKNQDGGFSFKNELKNHCWKMWHSCVVSWDGLVVPCCFDKDAKHRLGDLKKHTFSEIWNNKIYKDFRSKLLISRKEIDICKNCTEGTKIWG
jgi:radical SAM protein with 4Fe4S-binding SPASM domain